MKQYFNVNPPRHGWYSVHLMRSVLAPICRTGSMYAWIKHEHRGIQMTVYRSVILWSLRHTDNAEHVWEIKKCWSKWLLAVARSRAIRGGLEKFNFMYTSSSTHWWNNKKLQKSSVFSRLHERKTAGLLYLCFWTHGEVTHKTCPERGKWYHNILGQIINVKVMAKC